MKIVQFNKNIAMQNSYLLLEGKNGLVIDPGFNGESIHEYAIQNQILLTHVLLTHGHFDHIRDIRYLQKFFQFSIHLHEADEAKLSDESLNYARSFNANFVIKKDHVVYPMKDQEILVFHGNQIKIIHTPGHTSGSACFLEGFHLFSGDTLFVDAIGRTDLATGSSKQIMESIQKLLNQLSNEIYLYPGHGPGQTIKYVKTVNPFLKKLK